MPQMKDWNPAENIPWGRNVKRPSTQLFPNLGAVPATIFVRDEAHMIHMTQPNYTKKFYVQLN